MTRTLAGRLGAAMSDEEDESEFGEANVPSPGLYMLVFMLAIASVFGFAVWR